MPFLSQILEPPSYGYTRDGEFYAPSKRQIFREFFSRFNLLKTRKNWLPLFGWVASGLLFIPFVFFVKDYFSWPLAAVGFIYSMGFLGSHGTVWYHRFGTHRAYHYSHPVWRFLVRNLAIRIIPEEIYIVSHHVHHSKAEQPGDPYNVHGGFWYCFLADVVHQLVARDLSPDQYKRVANMVSHTGVKVNSYAQYQRWGSICHPFYTISHFALNWAFWYLVFFLIGGHALATCLFGSAFFWAFGVRTFNYSGHGEGKDKRKDGIDFNQADLSINQIWPGVVTGEWHNNHHLYPNGARAGFLPYQFDSAWWFILGLYKIGGISNYKDFKPQFYEKHVIPYQHAKEKIDAVPSQG